MAQNIFSSSDYELIVKRVGKLQPSCQRRWGKMNVLQMLEHCSLQLSLALGEIKQSTFEGPSFLRTSLCRWFALYGMPWTRNLRTPSKMNMLSNNVATSDFETAKARLTELLTLIKASKVLAPHPFLGSMSQKDWGRLIWIHLDHHLRQFGG